MEVRFFFSFFCLHGSHLGHLVVKLIKLLCLCCVSVLLMNRGFAHGSRSDTVMVHGQIMMVPSLHSLHRPRQGKCNEIPSAYVKIAIENGHL